MANWLDKLAKVLALALDTRVEPEKHAAFAIATDLAARHRLSLGRAYLRLERSMPGTFRYLESKRVAAGIPGFVIDEDAEPEAAAWGTATRGTPSGDTPAWDPGVAHYAGNRAALEAMLSCTVRPLRARRG